jgi:simple sugar transport system substrate-binding protein
MDLKVKVKWTVVVVSVLTVLLAGPAGDLMAAEKPFVFGLLLVGPYNDHGWSQAHYEAGHYVEKHVPGSRMIYIDKVNPADRPGVTIAQLADDLVEKGARLIIANSDDMKDGTREAAAMHPDVKRDLWDRGLNSAM